MVIGIDAREVQEFPTGIGRYFVGLVGGLLDIQLRHPELVSGSLDTKMLNRVPHDGGSVRFILFVNKGNPLIDKKYSENWEVRIVRARPKSFLQQFLFPIDVWLTFRRIPPPRSPAGDYLGGVERILLTNPFGFTVFCPVPQALIILDLIHKYVPQEASFKAKLYDAVLGKLVARRAGVVFTCSENSKRDIVKFLGVSEEKVVVTPLGVPQELRRGARPASAKASARQGDGKCEDILKKHNVKRPYVLYVGNLRPHKNVERLVTAVAEVKNQKSKIKNGGLEELNLVIVGSDVRERKFGLPITDYRLPKYIKILNSIPDEDLAILYRQAEMLVQSSLYEGFGMSVLEAMACGCPVVASKTSSIPEVGGDVPVYVDPEDPKDIARGIIEVLGYNEMERVRVVEEGLKQVRKFSWKTCARRTLNTLQKS